MKKIKLLVVFVSMLLCVMLAGCGSNEEIVDSGETTKEEQTKSTDKDDKEVEEIADTLEVTDESEDEQEILNESEAGPAYEILNNGGHFVGIGDWVYYLEPSDKAMQESRIFGEYIDSFCGETVLQSYNIKTGSFNPLFTDCGCGRLWMSGTKMFVASYKLNSDGYPEVVTYDLENGKKDTARGTNLMKGDTKGNYLVTCDYAGDTTICVYSNGELIKSIIDVSFQDVICIEDGMLVIACCRENYDDQYLKCIDLTTDAEYILGDTPKREYEDYGVCPEYEQSLIKDGKLYLSMSWYEGSGHFLAEQAWVTAELAKENSLRKVEIPSNGADSESEGDFESSEFVVIDGNMLYADGVPGTGYCDKYTSGQYGYIDENGKKVVCGEGFKSNFSDDEVGFDCECVDYVGKNLFMYNNNILRDPDGDIGWRYSYVRECTSIFCEEAGKDNGNNIVNYINPDYVNED